MLIYIPHSYGNNRKENTLQNLFSLTQNTLFINHNVFLTLQVFLLEMHGQDRSTECNTCYSQTFISEKNPLLSLEDNGEKCPATVCTKLAPK